MTSPDVVVVGGGAIGLSSAWRLAQRGAEVVVYDDPATRPAAWVAAGMLTPVTEAYWGEDALLALTIASMDRWAAMADELTAATGLELGFEQKGVLAVGLDTDDAAVIDDLHQLHLDHGLQARRLSSKATRELEPLLAPGLRAGVWADGDGAVDPRRLLEALRAAAVGAGVAVVDTAVDGIVVDGHRARGVTVDGSDVAAATVVLAAGAWSSRLAGLPAGLVPPVRPVYGEVVRLLVRTPGHCPGRVLRAVVRGRHVYVVPRDSGEIVIGATSLDRGFDTTVTAGGVYELLRDAQLVVPGLAEAELVETAAGLRPGTPDNAPIVGWSGLDGLFFATGHYRNGILLTPITAATVAASVAGQPDDAVAAVIAAACDPARFTPEMAQ